MKDLNLNYKNTDPETDNGNTAELKQIKSETAREDFNKNEMALKNTENSTMATSNETNVKEDVTHETDTDETDKVSIKQEEILSKTDNTKETVHVIHKRSSTPPPTVPAVLKYKYRADQWSPVNVSGKKNYDVNFLKQIRYAPLSKSEFTSPLLEARNLKRATMIQDPPVFNPMTRPMNDTLFPSFAKSPNVTRSNIPSGPKKEGRGGSMKLSHPTGGSNSQKAVIHMSLTREEVKLNKTKDAWKPARLKNPKMNEEEYKTQELYKKFRGILNKLTPEKFDTLVEKVKTLEINNQTRLEGVIDLVFQKAIDEPNFSKAYANLCRKLMSIKVPANNAPADQYVNFGTLIVNRCYKQFVTEEVDESILKLEKEMNECTDPAKKKELQLLLEEENRKVRMKSVGNVRFIGELYKLKILGWKVMDFCMKYLVEKLEEEKLECLCKLLTTIGEQVENEVKEQLDAVFKKMQYIVDKKSNKISSRVRFMIKDVIELRRRRWIAKTVIDSQPKMMDQIQKEAEQQQRHIELMNSPMGGYGRWEDGGRGKRSSEGRRQGNNYMDNNWKTTPRVNYTVDMSKLKAVTQKSLTNIKLAPQDSSWKHGSGVKSAANPSSNSMIGLTKNKYSMLEDSSVDPTLLKDMKTPNAKGASIERSTFSSRNDFNNDSQAPSRSTIEASPVPTAEPAAELPPPVAPPSEPLPDEKKKAFKSMIELNLINPNHDEVVAEIQQHYAVQYHTAVIAEIINIALEKSHKYIEIQAKTVLHLCVTQTISADNFLSGMAEILEFAPDLYIDIPMLYVYLGKFISPLIEQKLITLAQVFKLCEKTIIPANHGHLMLKAIIGDLKESMGPSFAKSKWEDSGLQLNQWMNEDQVAKWLENNKFEFLQGAKVTDEIKKELTPAEVQSKLLQLMNSEESCDCIKGWIQDNLGELSNEEFTRAVMQAICRHALIAGDGTWHLSHERMHKFAGLLHELASKSELGCLFAVQRLVHQLEHPQGLTLDIFQYLHEQYIISVEGFIAWEATDKEPEGKAVMLKVLNSFLTSIRELDNEDSCSED